MEQLLEPPILASWCAQLHKLMIEDISDEESYQLS